jgi:hypothetical protein
MTIHSKIDLIGQVVMIVMLLVGTLTELNAFLFFLLYFYFFIGVWQLSNGIISAFFYKNATKRKYVLFALLYLATLWGGLLIGESLNISNYVKEAFYFGYFGVGCFLFASWYFWQTLLAVGWLQNREPRTFWDFKF